MLRSSTLFSSLVITTLLCAVALGDSVTFTPPNTTDSGYVSSGWVSTEPPSSGSSVTTGSITVDHSENLSTLLFRQSVGLVRFLVDIPAGSTVDSATLRLSRSSYTDTNSLYLGVDSYPASNWPITTSDYTAYPGGGAGGTSSSVWTGAATVIDIPVNASTVNVGDWTAYRIGFTSGTVSGYNTVAFSSCSLIVYYTPPPSSGSGSRIMIVVAGE